MRPPEIQKKLDDMTLDVKKARTTPEAMYERGIVVKDYDYRILCKNEYPHDDRGEDQMVLWAWQEYRNRPYASRNQNAILMLHGIQHERSQKWYTITLHSQKEQSCPFREHRHIYLPQ